MKQSEQNLKESPKHFQDLFTLYKLQDIVNNFNIGFDLLLSDLGALESRHPVVTQKCQEFRDVATKLMDLPREITNSVWRDVFDQFTENPKKNCGSGGGPG